MPVADQNKEAADARNDARDRDSERSGMGARFGTPPAGTKETSSKAIKSDINFSADNAKGPIESLGLSPVEQALFGAVVPGAQAISFAHGAAQFIGGGIRDLLELAGATTTAPAIASGPESISDPDRGRDRDNPIFAQIAEEAGAKSSSLDIGEQIIMQAGMDKIAEMLGITTDGEDDEEEKQEEKTSSTEKKTDSAPTQTTEKPVEEAAEERDAGQSNLEKLFLDLINGKLDIQL